MDTSAPLTPTPANEWRNASGFDGIVLALPSGLTAKIRPVGLDLYIKLGRIPNFVAPTIKAAMDEPFDSDGNPITHNMPAPVSLQERKEWLEFLDDLARVQFVDPQVVTDDSKPLQANQIRANDISLQDKTFLLNYLGDPAKQLAFFRQWASASLEYLQALPANREDAIGIDGRESVGESDNRYARYVDGTAVR